MNYKSSKVTEKIEYAAYIIVHENMNNSEYFSDSPFGECIFTDFVNNNKGECYE